MINPAAKKTRRERKNAYMRTWTAKTSATPEGKAKLARWHRSAVLKRKFGITADDYDRMLAEQGGVCAICGHPPKKRRLAVDHDHKTKVVRGLLCFSCNYFTMGRGMTIEKARALVAYVDKYSNIMACQPLRPSH